MSQCSHCGHDGRRRLRHPGRLLAVGLAWLIPLTFLMQGYWPFGIIPITLLTAWAVLTNERICYVCGASWSSRFPDDPHH
jgi:hypothetical protein